MTCVEIPLLTALSAWKFMGKFVTSEYTLKILEWKIPEVEPQKYKIENFVRYMEPLILESELIVICTSQNKKYIYIYIWLYMQI